MYYCPKPYGYTQSCDSNGETKDYYKTLICEKCWFDAKKNVTNTNVGNKNETTLPKAKLKEIMKQLWQETENVLGNEMVDFYSIERIIRDVLGMDNSEEEK